jgi:uncharacterized protein YbjT (DUF2867 family)
MRVFVTGATGFIGSAVVKELLSAGHQVLGLSRSDEGAQALGSALAGSNRPLIVTSGTGMANTIPGQPATDDAATISSDVIPRAASEEAAVAVAAEGINASVVRLPQVHDSAKQGLVGYAITVYREKGACAYIGDGLNRWPAA